MSGLVRANSTEVETTGEASVNVLVYSGDRTRRAEIMAGVGRRPAKGAPTITWFEAATEFGVYDLLQKEDFSLMIFDGETGKVGGMGLAKQIKDEVEGAPPVLLLIARQQDEWLGRWSQAEGLVSYPIEPRVIQSKVAELLQVRR